MSGRTSRRTPTGTAVRTVVPGAPCPCGLGQPYDECCGALHRGPANATTAQLLMRSRYSAFAAHDPAYLLRTWHPATRPRELRFDPDVRWTRLEIIGAVDGGPFHSEGTVEFRAHYAERGNPHTLHEVSRFGRSNGLWVYLGPVPDPTPTGQGAA